MEAALNESKLQLLRLNLIPGTGILSKVAPPEDHLPERGDAFCREDSIAIETITIDIHGTIYAGTEIRIGNCTMKLEKTVSKRQIKLHPNKKRVISAPLKLL